MIKYFDEAALSYFWNKIRTTDIAAILTTTWVGASAPYTQVVPIAGLASDINIAFGVAITATASEYEAAAKANLHKSAQASGQITITAFGEKPTVAIPIHVRLII